MCHCTSDSGGLHVTYLPEETLKENPAVDIVARGAGEVNRNRALLKLRPTQLGELLALEKSPSVPTEFQPSMAQETSGVSLDRLNEDDTLEFVQINK